MKEKYEAINIEVIFFEVESDIVTSSNEGEIDF